MDPLEGFNHAWVRAGHGLGLAIDPQTIPAPTAVSQTIREYREFARDLNATSSEVLRQVDVLAPQAFASGLLNAGLFSVWPALMEQWPPGLPVMTTWIHLVEMALRIYWDEVRPRLSLDELQLMHELDEIMAS